MTAYMLVAIALVTLALLATQAPRLRTAAGLCSAVLLALFAGLRFETGYDWAAYESYFDSVRSIGEICEGVARNAALLVEPLYMAFNFIIKSVGGNVWVLFFIVATFNIAVIHFVAGRISPSQTQMWIVYFGIAYLIAQFSLVRQSMGNAFVFLGLLQAAYNRPLRGAGWFIIAAGFQFTTLLLAPVLALRNWRPDWRMVAAFVGLGLILTVARIELWRPVAELIVSHAPSWLATKTAFYATLDPVPVSLATVALICFHLLVLGTLYVIADSDEARDRFITIAIWLTLAVLAAHLYLPTFPSFWNRLMLVSIPWQIAAVYRLEWVRKRPKALQHAAVVGLSSFSSAALFYTLMKPASLPFIPYHSLVQEVAGYDSDGTERSQAAMARYIEKNQRGGSPLQDSSRNAFRNDETLNRRPWLTETTCSVLGHDVDAPKSSQKRNGVAEPI